MDAEDPLFILYTPVPLENQREWCIHSRIYGLHSLYFKMYLIMKTTIFSGVLQILVG
jgi:hypothetical protein